MISPAQPLPPASLLRRLAGTAYEALLLCAIVLALGFLLLPVLTPGPGAAGGSSFEVLTPARRAVSFAAIVLLCGAYCVWLWSGGRRTLPMKTWRLQLATIRVRNLGVGRAAARYAAWWIGPAFALAAAVALRPSGHALWALPLLATNYAWALIDPEGQFLHDRLAGTRLIAEAARATGTDSGRGPRRDEG